MLLLRQNTYAGSYSRLDSVETEGLDEEIMAEA